MCLLTNQPTGWRKEEEEKEKKKINRKIRKGIFSGISRQKNQSQIRGGMNLGSSSSSSWL